MPYEFLPSSRNDVVALRTWGKWTSDDAQSLGLKLGEITAQAGSIRVLVDARDEGFADEAAESEDFML